MSPTAHAMILPKLQRQSRPCPHNPATQNTPSSDPVACPSCGHTSGFILDEDGFGYRVLEDQRDTDLLDDHAEDTLLACAHCDTTITLVDALALTLTPTRTPTPTRTRTPTPPSPSTHRTDRRKRTGGRRPHDSGPARLRTGRAGQILPACPECPRDHNFLADLDGMAFHVLEDDSDTDLLEEVGNLLCPDCGAVFTTATTAMADHSN